MGSESIRKLVFSGGVDLNGKTAPPLLAGLTVESHCGR